MTDPRTLTCQRCDEPLKQEAPDLVSRLTGTIVVRTYTIRWTSWITRPLLLMRDPSDAVRASTSEMTLCSECWGALLSWCNAPEQERRRIAAENRRSIARKAEFAAERREREISVILAEGDRA